MIKTVKNIVPGLFLVAALTLIALTLGGLPLFHGTIPVSPLVLAIIIGVALNNTVKLPPSAEAGIGFAARRILRVAVIFLGFRISASQIAGAGPLAAGVVLVSSTLTILFTLWLGMRLKIPVKRPSSRLGRFDLRSFGGGGCGGSRTVREGGRGLRHRRRDPHGHPVHGALSSPLQPDGSR